MKGKQREKENIFGLPEDTALRTTKEAQRVECVAAIIGKLAKMSC
jgi:hypothetical protein